MTHGLPNYKIATNPVHNYATQEFVRIDHLLDTQKLY